jgi:DnaK suppressor protein
MKKEIIQNLKKRLEKDKENIEEELQNFAKKDLKIKGNWKTKFPHFDGGVGSQRMEEAADEVEEYITLLPIESRLELKLKEINSALERVKKGKYGKCEKCKKDIPLARLKAYPEARACLKCK